MVRPLLLLLLVIAPVTALGGWQDEPIKALYSAPSSAGEPQFLSLRVKYRSDGYRRLGCELIASSGYEEADAKACDALPQVPTKGTIETRAPVWIPGPYEGAYRGPVAATNPASWLRYFDVPKSVYAASQGGIAIFRLDVDASGKLAKCAVYVPSNNRVFDALVERNICKRAAFKPATLDNVPTGATLLMAFRYFSPDSEG